MLCRYRSEASLFLHVYFPVTWYFQCLLFMLHMHDEHEELILSRLTWNLCDTSLDKTPLPLCFCQRWPLNLTLPPLGQRDPVEGSVRQRTFPPDTRCMGSARLVNTVTAGVSFPLPTPWNCTKASEEGLLSEQLLRNHWHVYQVALVFYFRNECAKKIIVYTNKTMGVRAAF